jgi:hypothetical protein
MTRFLHQQHSGRRKRGRKRQQKGLGIRSLEALKAHRELAFLRNPNAERARKLAEVERRAERARKLAEVERRA